MADNPTSNAKTALVPGIPFPPAGYDENGKPYWLINGAVVDWSRMQQYIWQQAKEAKQAKGAQGPETLAQLASAEVNLEVQPRIEQPRTPEQADRKMEISGEQGLQTGKRAGSVTPGTPATKLGEKKQDKPDFFGDSPALPNLAADNPALLLAQAKTLAKAPDSTSDRFLGVSLLRKLLQLAFGHKS
jgi:hypothetical protein